MFSVKKEADQYTPQTPFLTAEWRNLLNLTYRVPPEILQPYLPKGIVLDVQNGTAFASIVAFDFLNTRVRRLKIPFHVNFPEINLRYYVKYKNNRAVCFVREFVPKFCIALVADKLYNEPYQAIPMQSQLQIKKGGDICIRHDFTKNHRAYYIEATANKSTQIFHENTLEHYFKEHDLGFGTDKKGQTLSYKVLHPIWETYMLENYAHNLDFGHIYGPQWAFLNKETPFCALLAKGSAVEVYPPTAL